MGICDSLCINSIAIRAISCCFVIAVRADLREEFDMADEAFALSPISARATLPSEEDYAAIAEAFMETSRGRWFLTEYAKRNRNADTRMVQDAVIEKGTDQFSSEEARAALRAAFAALQGRLVEFGDDDRALPPAAETEAAAPSPAAPETAPEPETAEAASAQKVAETSLASL